MRVPPLRRRHRFQDGRTELCNSERKVRELPALIDTGENGKISKQQWMKFTGAEFDNLDKNKKGEVDPKDPLPRNKTVRFDPK